MSKKAPGKSWVKPWQDPIVRDVANIMEKAGGYTIAEISKQTGLVPKTIKNMRDRVTGQPHPTTARFLLRYFGKELVIRDMGEKE